MADKEQEDEFMKQYMEACKEQIGKLAKDPELLNQTLEPFMQMSRQIMAGGSVFDGAMPNILPGVEDLNINSAVDQLGRIKDYIVKYVENNHEELVKMYNSRDRVIIRNLNKYSKELREAVKSLVLDLRNEDKG